MAKEFVTDVTCKMKFDVMTNRDGNILQDGEEVAGKKSFTFSGFASTIMANEAVNTDDSPALHNGVAGLMWLFSGIDENFDELSVKKTSTEEIDYV